MNRARPLQQVRRFLLNCTIGISAILFLVSVTTAQSSVAEQKSAPPESVFFQELNKYPGLMPELSRLAEKLLHNIQFPAPRKESHLLSLLPLSTTGYLAVANYGDATHQALAIFRQELQESSVLRDWWEHGSVAAGGPKTLEALDKVYQFQEYLGDEFVVSGATEARDFRPLIIAEIRKPGLKKFLEQLLDKIPDKSKAGVRVLDLQELAAAQRELRSSEDLIVLVRSDFVIASSDLATLRSFNERLDRLGTNELKFVSTPFGARVAQEYHYGITMLAAADLHKFLDQLPGASLDQPSLQRSGFADIKYLVWDHRNVGAETLSQAELSFTSPRHGAAAWLGKPVPLNSLDFVSPKAMAVLSMVLANPVQVFEDVKLLATTPTSNPFAAIPAFEQMLQLNLKDDLLSLLGGELTLEVDTLTAPRPEWRAMLAVNDANHLDQTFTKLFAASHLQASQVSEGGVTYHTVPVPAAQGTIEIAYAFVDGYLIVGSSRDVVAKAVDLHKSGDSLPKSAKFLEALPPGHSASASALFYEDPVAMSTLTVGQTAPEIANLLTQASGTAPPLVLWAYGEENAIIEASKGGNFDVGAMLVVAAIAIPNLLRSRIAANEASAVGSVRTVNTAQVVYSNSFSKRGFAPNLASLGPAAKRGKSMESPDHADLLDGVLAAPICTGDAWCTKSGYQFRVTATCKQGFCKDYLVVAIPVSESTGRRSFCSASDGLIRLTTDASLTAPTNIADCKKWPALQ